jgi:hypothetical protein
MFKSSEIRNRGKDDVLLSRRTNAAKLRCICWNILPSGLHTRILKFDSKKRSWSVEGRGGAGEEEYTHIFIVCLTKFDLQTYGTLLWFLKSEEKPIGTSAIL